jgi:hypothetical protein
MDVRRHSWRRRFWPVPALLAVLVLWVVDGLIRGAMAERALETAGYAERTTGRHLWPRRCGLLSYEAVFWGQGPRAPEAQGYVCVGFFAAPVIHRVGFDEPLDIDIHG